MKHEQFVDEFVLNIINQYPKELGSMEKIEGHREVFREIYLDYLYQVCPQIAIFRDPKILDATRKMKIKNLDSFKS